MMIKLPQHGDWINPKYVTLIELGHKDMNEVQYTRLWVVANAGYGTKQIDFRGDVRDELAKLINKA